MSVDFAAILNTQAAAVEAPKTVPDGVYKGVIKSFVTGVSDQKKTPFVEFTYALMTPVDVQPENQQAAAAALSKGPAEMTDTYYVTEKSLYRLVEMLEKVGVPRASFTVAQMIPQAPGKPVLVAVKHEASKKDPTKTFANVASVVKA